MKIKKHKFRHQTLIGTKAQVQEYIAIWNDVRIGTGPVANAEVVPAAAVFILSGLPVDLSVVFSDNKSPSFQEKMDQLLYDRAAFVPLCADKQKEILISA